MKKSVIRIIIGAVLFAVCIFLPAEGILRLFLFLIPYLIIGGDVLWRAVRNIFRGRVFDENFLMSIATVGALALQDYPEAVAVMLFYQVGELFQAYAVRQSRKSISELMDIRPDTANVVREETILTIAPEEVQVGETILVKVGEKIPLDGIVTEGSSLLDTSALTGESMPREIQEGDSVISGCINTSAVLKIRVTKVFEESTVSKILDLVENASSQKAKSENFITKFAGIYTPVVVIAAVLLAVVPPMVLQTGFSEWINRALIFLVVSCPCALVLSVPLSFFGGIGGASRQGILVKGSNYLEALARAETVVFDKTGTLTQGTFAVTEILPVKISQEDLLMYAAHAEVFSDHPLSLSLKKAYGVPDANRVTEAEELAGYGVKALVDGIQVCAGNKKMMERLGLTCENPGVPGTVIHVAVGAEYAGCVVVADRLKGDAETAIQHLRDIGVKNVVMLTGDNRNTAEAVAEQLQIDRVWSELLPGDKVSEMENILTERLPGSAVAFVGDGINDAPVLALADIGIAMGGLGSDAAIEAADVVLMDDMPSKIASAIKIARRTLKIVKENIVFALAVKGIVLILSALGLANMWWAVFADVGVSFLAILNAARALQVKNI